MGMLDMQQGLDESRPRRNAISVEIEIGPHPQNVVVGPPRAVGHAPDFAPKNGVRGARERQATPVQQATLQPPQRRIEVVEVTRTGQRREGREGDVGHPKR